MRSRKIVSIALDVLALIAVGVLAVRLVTGDFRYEAGPFKIAAQRVSRIVLVLMGLLAVRVLVETGGNTLSRLAGGLGRLAFGRGPDGERWPFAAAWWITLPILLGAAGAAFGLAHAGRIVADRAGALSGSAITVVFLLSWILPGLMLGLSLGAAWTLILGLGRHLGLLPGPSAKDVKLTLLLGGAAMAVAGQAFYSDWVYPSRLGEFAAGIAAILLGAAGMLVFAVVYPMLARRTRTGFAAAVGIPLVALLLYGLAGPSAARTPEGGRPPRHVVLISMDTTRADHLSCYGYERETSPEIDAIAAESVRFEWGFVPQSSTDPSHVTMLTGIYPREHGVVTNGLSIANPDTPSLAEWFRARGYATAAITSRSHLNPDDLLLPGFDYYSVPTSRKATGMAHEAYARAVAWIDQHKDQDYFLWVHFWDPHNQYEPPAPDRDLFNDGYRGPCFGECGFQTRERSDEDAIYRESLYDAEIHYADRYVGRLVRHLDETSPDEAPIIALLGDHGEIMREYLRPYSFAFDHAWFISDMMLHVPFLVRWKGHIEPAVVPDVVESVNLAATLADLAAPGSWAPGLDAGEAADGVRRGRYLGEMGGVPVKRSAQVGGRAGFRTFRRSGWYDADSVYRSRGVSLVPLMRGEPLAEAGVAYAWRRAKATPAQHWLGTPAFSVRDGRWRYVLGGRDGEALYDMQAESFELENVLEDHPEVAARLRREVEVWKLRIPETSPDLGSFTDTKREDMEQLGYTGN